MVEKIYFDMDGVLADFEKGLQELCDINIDPQNKQILNNDDEMWMKIKEVDHFYDKLDPLPDAKKMFDKIYSSYPQKCEILTGIPKPKRGILTAGEDKISWIRRELSADIPINIVFREEKPRYCTGKGCILIDDMKKNIKDWNNNGGTGIRHKSPENTLQILMDMGLL